MDAGVPRLLAVDDPLVAVADRRGLHVRGVRPVLGLGDAEREAELADRNAQVIPMPLHEGQVDVRAVLDWMADQQINEVHAEAGARLSGALIDAGVVDQLLMYLAPKILGQGRGVADITELAGLDDVEPFEFTDVRLLGADLRVLARQRDHWEALLRAVGGAYPSDLE